MWLSLSPTDFTMGPQNRLLNFYTANYIFQQNETQRLKAAWEEGALLKEVAGSLS